MPWLLGQFDHRQFLSNDMIESQHPTHNFGKWSLNSALH